MERFRKLTLRIWNLDPNVALHHLVTALRAGPFADNMCKKPAHDLDKLRYMGNTSYNVLLGQPSLNQLGTIVSTPHLSMKFPFSMKDIMAIHVEQKTARECYVASLRLEPIKSEHGKFSKRTRGKEEVRSVNVTDLDL